jgi:hypothetical protein
VARLHTPEEQKSHPKLSNFQISCTLVIAIYKLGALQQHFETLAAGIIVQPTPQSLDIIIAEALY